MDPGTYSDDEHTPPSSPEEPIYTSFGGGMFAGSQYFSIGGGTFNNTTNHYHPPPAESPNFRLIPMGDIDLQRELTVNGKSVIVDHRLGRQRRCVRRVYSAKIDGRSTNSTVAIYQGDGAEEDWRHDIEIYMSLRHPNIVQMYGTANSGAMYATIFHGDLIPIQLVASASPIMRVYISACYVHEWEQACHYVEDSLHISDSVLAAIRSYSTVSIRRSNGRLCADFVPQPISGHSLAGGAFFSGASLSDWNLPPINPSLDMKTQEATAVASLTLGEYHALCTSIGARVRSGFVSISARISCEAVFLFPPNGQPEEGAEISSLAEPQFQVDGSGWWYLDKKALSRMVMKSDWIRFDTKDVCSGTFTHSVKFDDADSAWLTQASHIFSCLQSTSHLEDYVLVQWVDFQITIGNTREDTLPGYLFLCPTTDVQSGPSSFKWPDCPAYWSFDPLGLERLSTNKATQLGFPVFRLTTRIRGWSWDTSVYTGLRQFHQSKGFDPESQDVALHLGLPLYKLSQEVDSPFAHVEQDGEDEEDGFNNGTNEGETEDEWEDAQSSLEVEQDGDKSTEDFDANEDEGLLNSSTEPREQNTAHSVDQDPNPAESRVLRTGIGFIHRIIGELQQGLVTESEDLDTDPISPFLV